MRAYHSDCFELPLPPEHRFPMAKYRLLRRAVAAALPDLELCLAEPVADHELLRVHDASYVERVKRGRLTAPELRSLGFPWSPQLVERSRRSVGGTLAACRCALELGSGVNLAGGTHHAFADRGAGYCVFNDTAVAARAVQAEALAERVLVIDCDVHQGDGTAAIFAGDPTVFTLSLHGAGNYPLRKQESDLDVALADGAGDEEYLAALAAGLTSALASDRFDLAIFLAGADPYVGDRLGRLAVSAEGLARRDRLVLDVCKARRLPVAVVMAGGYCEDLGTLVELHLATVRAVVDLCAVRERVAGG